MKTLLLYGSLLQSNPDRLAELLALLAKPGVTLAVERTLAHSLEKKEGFRLPPGCKLISSPDEAPGAFAALSIGGDGTFLQTAQWIGERDIPIMGINTGHLGYLTACSLNDDLQQAADALLEGNMRADSRELIEVAGDLPEGIWPYALNEVAIFKEETSSMINIHTELGAAPLADYLGDGLVVSTPTGSTGYNLSVGGPILQPELSCLVLSPIAPHTLTLRPLVVDGASIIYATTTTRASDYRVSLDGRSFLMPSGSSLRISRAPFRVRILHLPASHFAETLRAKLLWGRR